MCCRPSGSWRRAPTSAGRRPRARRSATPSCCCSPFATGMRRTGLAATTTGGLTRKARRRARGRTGRHAARRAWGCGSGAPSDHDQRALQGDVRAGCGAARAELAGRRAGTRCHDIGDDVAERLFERGIARRAGHDGRIGQIVEFSAPLRRRARSRRASQRVATTEPGNQRTAVDMMRAPVIAAIPPLVICVFAAATPAASPLACVSSAPVSFLPAKSPIAVATV